MTLFTHHRPARVAVTGLTALALATTLPGAGVATSHPSRQGKVAKADAAGKGGGGGRDKLRSDPAGVIDLRRGYHYDVLATAGQTWVRSTESGATFRFPEDPDANTLWPRRNGRPWLLTAHELTQPREGDYQGDEGKVAVPEQSVSDDGDSDGWGSVTRLTLSKNGRRTLGAQVITTGLHNLCAGAVTPWGNMLVNEEFPFRDDPDLRSGWVWQVNPRTGKAKRATGMGRFSHEQEALATDGNWYLTNDFGGYEFLFKYVPPEGAARDLVHGKLYGLAYDHETNTGRWIGPLYKFDPTADMLNRGYTKDQGFNKAEGIVVTPNGRNVVFSESGSKSNADGSRGDDDPGRVWKLKLGRNKVSGSVLLEGSFDTLSHPDNVRFAPSGDLFVYEDNGSSTELANGGTNEIRVLPRGATGTGATKRFASIPNGGEPTGPWFSPDGKLLYMSVQSEESPSRVITIRGPRTFWQSIR